MAKNNISLYCTEINQDTKIMYQIFKDIYNKYNKCEFNLIPLTTVTNITNDIGDTCSKIYLRHRLVKI